MSKSIYIENMPLSSNEQEGHIELGIDFVAPKIG